jgi:hypothetical protein
MIHIKSLNYDHSKGLDLGYGHDYQVRVSETTAKQLAGMYPMPTEGDEICVAVPRLMLANIGGQYFLRHRDVPVRDWTKVFKIEVAGAETTVEGV